MDISSDKLTKSEYGYGKETLKVWFGSVLWHINHYRLFDAKFLLYVYIKYMISKHIL